MSDKDPMRKTFGHGGITLTFYPSSGRVQVEVTATNACMEWWELDDFVDMIKKPAP